MPSFSKKKIPAFQRQNGYCYYCHAPMWLHDAAQYAFRHGITIAQAKRFQCTAEHLEARRDGGSDAALNIVAACHFCNQKRHQRKTPLSPPAYKRHVQKRIQSGGWHPVKVDWNRASAD